MVEFTYRRKGLTIKEMSFGTINDLNVKGCDVIYMHSNDVNDTASRGGINNVIKQFQYTLVNDLTKDEDELYSKINKNYRYEIRRAIKEKIECSIYTNNDISEFQQIYNDMFSSKGMKNKFNIKLVKAGLAAKYILISKAIKPGNNNIIVYHAYLVDGNSAMLMYSASTLNAVNEKYEVNMIGWMNKYLHWHDIKWMKENGYQRYEWGGIGNPNNLSGIAKFKLAFGGQVVAYYNYMKASSVMGKIYVFLVKRSSNKWK